MSFPQKTHLVLLAAVSAFLVLRAAKRAHKKPLLTSFEDAASKVDADGFTGQGLFDTEYDIIIVGGGEFPFLSIYLGPSTSRRNRGLCSRRPSLRGAQPTGFAGRIWGKVLYFGSRTP